jgi:hypothetical protein
VASPAPPAGISSVRLSSCSAPHAAPARVLLSPGEGRGNNTSAQEPRDRPTDFRRVTPDR